MKNILVITDSSKANHQSMLLATSMAKYNGARLLIINVGSAGKAAAMENYAFVAKNSSGTFVADLDDTLAENLNVENQVHPDFQQHHTDKTAKAYTTIELLTLIRQNNIEMVITDFPAEAVSSGINFQSILNQIQCPLLLVPENSRVNSLKRITYLSDLRYCRTEILRYLVKMAKPYQASVLIAQLSLSGLPHLADNYAEIIFKESIYPLIGYEQLIYQNIKERDIVKAADVLVNGMNSDLLVLENRRFHFEEILGRHIPHVLPVQLPVPLLIFPY